MTLREVIAMVVGAEVVAYETRREARRLDRVLSRGEIERGAEAGAVRPEAREVPAAPDVDEAIGVALEAFEDGLYLVAIDGVEARDLDAQVYVKPDSRIVIVRLVFLAGA